MNPREKTGDNGWGRMGDNPKWNWGMKKKQWRKIKFRSNEGVTKWVRYRKERGEETLTR
jgi:hypothetical protein